GPLRFRGTPLLVEGLAPFRYQEIMAGAIVRVSLSVDQGISAEPTNIQTVPEGESATWVRFSLAAATPAGAYRGEVRLDESAYPISVDLEGKPQLHLSPKGVTLTAASASTVVMEMTAMNGGNLAFEIPDTGTFGMFA